SAAGVSGRGLNDLNTPPVTTLAYVSATRFGELWGNTRMDMSKRLAAEFLGTFWLVLGGCGSAVLAAHFGGDGNPLGIGFHGVALAFGLTVLTGAYAFGHISGAHFN